MSHHAPPDRLEEYDGGYTGRAWHTATRGSNYHHIIAVHYGWSASYSTYNIVVYGNTDTLDITCPGYENWYSQVLATLYIYASDPLV
jgi:hypothetical protein